jgi:chromosome segregation protein
VYLKRLDLQGFKSFASKTTFEFGHGITAIVGPNGSGKSNIADSLRWVLGEQSGRLLRAKKLDDIIYAGSAKRAKSDRVEVAMTLDNSNGWLPLDVSEVTISRRGTRSGDSDYFINGKKTRLRELQALLLKATVTQSSYAIIGQGLVETVLNLRPDERRELIEEAADIARFRFRIEEAEERLKGTHENVERVKLLMKEIAPRLGRLERQAQVAGEHARLSRELTDALQVYYEHQWHRSQESLTVSRASHDQAQAEFTGAKVALETCQRELDDVTKELDAQRSAAASVIAERERLEARIRDLERSAAVAAERRGILQARRNELAEELEGLRTEKEQLADLLAKDGDEPSRLEAAVASAREAFEAKQGEMTALEQEYREAVDRVADAEAKGKRLEAAAEELKARARRMGEGRRETEKERSRLETRRRSLINQMAEQLRLLRGHRAQEGQLVASVADTGDRRVKLESEVTKLREQLAAVEGTQGERRAKVEGLQSRLGVLEEAQKQAEGHGDEAISIEGAVATVFEVIRVPKGLEEAISAALSDQIEAFVFERQSEAIAAIQAVIAQRGPRTVVLPLDTMKPVYPLTLMKEKGVMGVASRLIKYQQKYEKLINALLGRTIVVQDTATAARLVRRGLGTVVTTDGVVFHPSGHIAGGRAQAGRPFVLAYERDLEMIPKEIEKVRRSMEVTEREADGLREKLKEAETGLAALSKEAEDAMSRRTSVQDSLGQRQQRLAQLKGELRALVASQGAMRDREGDVAADVERMAGEQERMLEEAKEAFANAKYLEQANGVLTERREELQAAAREAAEALAQAEGALRSLEVQREAGESTVARLEAQASAKDVQLKGIELELETLASTGELEAVEAKEAQKQLDVFNENNAPSREGVVHLEVRQRDLHNQVLAAQGSMFEAERRVLEAEAEVRRWEMEIENLVTKMSEDGMAISADGSVTAPEAVQTRIPFWLTADGGEEGPGGLRPIQGGAHIDAEAMGHHIEELRKQLRGLGPVNIEALGDYESMRERHDFLAGQVSDLESAEASLHRAIEQLTSLMETRFESTFNQVAKSFEANFHAFFGEGGHAKLKLSDPKDMNATGIEIEAQPPGKRTKSLSQLSGGEKALTSLSFLFALLQANPSPFCVLDEVDAMLDEANVVRFATALNDLAERTQFIVVTHNRRTIETADSIYGVSMAADAASRVLSMRLADVMGDASVNLN